MRNPRFLINILIFMFLGAVVAWAALYGPSQRSFVVPGKSETVTSARELDRIWQNSGVRGRIAVIFSRRLQPHKLAQDSFPEYDYLETALRRGVVRAVYHVVPDRDWSQVVSDYLAMEMIVSLKPTDEGFVVLHDGGRINVLPLGKYLPTNTEQTLVVLDRVSWSRDEHSRINAMISSGLLATDLLVTIADGGQTF